MALGESPDSDINEALASASCVADLSRVFGDFMDKLASGAVQTAEAQFFLGALFASLPLLADPELRSAPVQATFGQAFEGSNRTPFQILSNSLDGIGQNALQIDEFSRDNEVRRLGESIAEWVRTFKKTNRV